MRNCLACTFPLPIFAAMESLVPAKITQATDLLDQLGLDLWLIFVRETNMHTDPTMEMVVGHHVTWQSVFFYTRTGRAIALVGNLDEANFRDAGCTEVKSYTAGVKEDLRAILDDLQPTSIALNYSTDDVAADGLTHGMYQLLCAYLAGTPYPDRFVSAEQLVTKLRSRKLPEEVDRLRDAAVTAETIWQETVGQFHIGMTEKEIAARLEQAMSAADVTPSFTTIVNAGDKTDPGHGLPSDARLEGGDLLHVDFGVRLRDYCSDLQRLVYFRRPNETTAPDELREAFTVVRDIITATAAACRPGVRGFEIDAIARQELRDHGYPEYEHALGHQLGRSVHDGGGILGPRWERYGRTPEIELEAGNVFTLELEINLPGIGCVGLEEDVHVTGQGAEFLCPRQMELRIV
ncbi:MAG: aminopeptidase P family protein [Candidatus Zixiibacteriota bacterium]|nr:MAG: aminopeptidase P family protein [candidate division Zixibacteria bacterium]